MTDKIMKGLKNIYKGRNIGKNLRQNIYRKNAKPKYDSETFLTDSCSMSHMVNTEENITNVNDTDTLVTVGDS